MFGILVDNPVSGVSEVILCHRDRLYLKQQVFLYQFHPRALRQQSHFDIRRHDIYTEEFKEDRPRYNTNFTATLTYMYT